MARSMSSPLAGEVVDVEQDPTLPAPAARARSTTAAASAARRSGYGLGPLTGSMKTVAPMPAGGPRRVGDVRDRELVLLLGPPPRPTRTP
jgi:hypothetical protein